jgi:uncharacterized protein YlzI (FlbEa/FlbD family)
MIRLNRLKHADPLYLNPDHIEWIEQHALTTIRLSNGNEYVVSDTAEQIIEMIRQERARIIGMALGSQPIAYDPPPAPGEAGQH